MAKRSKADVKHAIDLLWSHQIRRENAALHKEVKGLRQLVEVEAGEVRELYMVSEHAKTAAETAIACVEKALADQTTLQNAVDSAHRDAQDAINRVKGLEFSLQEARANQTQIITHFNKDVDKVVTEVTQLREQHQRELSQIGGAIRQISAQLEEESARAEIAAFEDRLVDIETLLRQSNTLNSISHVEDSVGEPYYAPFDNVSSRQHQMLASQSLIPGPSQFLNGPPPTTDSNEAEMMLTSRERDDHDMSIEVEEIDLDQNVTIMSYAKGMGVDVPVTESLAMLPDHDSHVLETLDSLPLKQGRFHSWDRYFAEGQALVSRLPRRSEFDIVRCFVEGLFASRQREQCEAWLDTNGWTWESVSNFGIQIASTPCNPLDRDQTYRRKSNRLARSPETRDMGMKRHRDRAESSKPSPKRQKESKTHPGPGPGARELGAQQSGGGYSASLSRGRDTSKPASQNRVQKARELNKAAWKRPRDENGRFASQTSAVAAVDSAQGSKKGHKAKRKVAVPKTRTREKDYSLPTRSTRAAGSKQREEVVTLAEKVIAESSPVRHTDASPSTPTRQRKVLDDVEQPVPRLVKRKCSVDRVAGEKGRKARRLMDEEGLPPLPAQPVQSEEKEKGKRGKGRRLPLPPPPEIPIMPTSDDD